VIRFTSLQLPRCNFTCTKKNTLWVLCICFLSSWLRIIHNSFHNAPLHLTFNLEIQPASRVIDRACRLILSDLATPENKKYPQVGEVGGSHNVEDNSTTHNTHKGVGYHQLSTNNVIVRPKNLTFILPHHVLHPFSFFFVLGPLTS
jgi:hypothetical protein